MSDRTRYGTRQGVLDIAPGASWTDVTSSDFEDPVTRAALPSGMRFVSVDALNDSSTITAYLQAKAQAGESTTNALRLPPNSAVDGWDLYHAGVVTTISHRGSGAGGSGQLVGYFLPG